MVSNYGIIEGNILSEVSDAQQSPLPHDCKSFPADVSSCVFVDAALSPAVGGCEWTIISLKCNPIHLLGIKPEVKL